MIGNAVKVMRIAMGEEAEEFSSNGKNAVAVSLGRCGGTKRAEIAKKAA